MPLITQAPSVTLFSRAIRACLGSPPAVAFGAMLLLAGCGGGGGESAIPIGEYSSLTGTAATFGTSTHKGATLVMQETNASGGVLGKQIKLLTEIGRASCRERV